MRSLTFINDNAGCSTITWLESTTNDALRDPDDLCYLVIGDSKICLFQEHEHQNIGYRSQRHM